MNQMFSGPAALVSSNMSHDLTNADLSAHLGLVASRPAGGLNVQFFYARVKTRSRNAMTNGQFQTRLCVAKQPKGDRFTVATRYITDERAQKEFPREYAAFKQFEDAPSNGTPLHELPGLSQSQIALLVLNGLRSVEDLADLSDDQAAQIGYEVTTAQKLARKWLSSKEGAAELIAASQMQAKHELEREALLKRLAAMEESNRALQAQVAAMATMKTGAPAAPEVRAIEVKDLPYDLRDMPLDMDSQAFVSGNDDLLGDIDPLAG